MIYDAVGNRSTNIPDTSPTVNEIATYTYDDENRLTGITITQGSNVKLLTFAYDPFGRRIKKTIVQDQIGTVCTSPNACPRTTNYIYDGQNIIAEYDQNNNITASYTHGPNIDEPLSVQKGTNTYYYHADGLGSITALSNSSGNIVQTYSYDSFGNITTTGNISQPFTYTGREYDSETGMFFYRARYYDPKVGMFVTKDPIGFDGGDVNLYNYVGASPVNWIDPYGLWKYYGNWGGPNWTGGQEGTWNNIDRTKAKPPIDKQDTCYRDHDICYGDCRDTTCKGRGRGLCFKQCDRKLAKCLDALGNDPSNDWRAKAAKKYFNGSNPGVNE